jgi:hypothetical protein
MIFSVIQYLPLIEEEVPCHKIELSKTDNSTDTEGGADTESDGDTDPLSDIFLSELFLTSNLAGGSASYFNTSEFNYSYQLNSIQSPPPKA